MVHYCSTESQCKDYKEKPGSCGSAAVPLLEIASKEKKTRHCKSCREANLGDSSILKVNELIHQKN